MKSNRILFCALSAAALFVPGVVLAHPGHSLLDPSGGGLHPGHEAEIAKLLVFGAVTALLIGIRWMARHRD